MAEVYRVGYGDGSVIRSVSPHVCARVQRHRQTASGSYLILPHPTTTCRGCMMIRYDGCGSILPYPTPFLCPTLDCSAIIPYVPYHTYYYVRPTTTNTGFQPNILPQPSSSYTGFSTILPYRTPSYIHYSTPIPHPTTTFFVQHFSHPTLSYPVLPQTPSS